ncbi:MAG: TonB-dependent receptor domain-containing protein [Pyrinomonadaceae bacterium]
MSVSQIFAQSIVTGAISGNVTDQQGALVPNASVTVTNTGTNSATTVTTNDDGGFKATSLQPGVYRVEVAAVSGFGASKAENIVVEVGRTSTVDFKLTAGGAVATVDVTSEAPAINTSDNANTQNDDQTAINERPINGRRWSNFAILSPSAVPDGTFGLISFRGISGLLNNNTIDGGDNNQAFFSEERGRTRINYVISQSAIREFQINTSNYSAEYGRSAGGVTNAVTKSGTNEFHGDAFYFNRNNRNGARNPRAFASTFIGGVSGLVAAKPIDLREQFGGTIGGPIVKDRLFFFFSYDQQKRNFPGLAAFTQGNYLSTANTACLTGAVGAVIAGCTGGGKGLTLTQVNNTLAVLNSFTGETPRKGDQTLFLPKVDWQINSANLFSISYNRLRWKSPNGIQTQAVNNRGRSSFGDDFVDVDSINARLQSNITANILNEARFQYGRDFETQFSTAPLPGEPATSRTAIGGVRAPDIFLTNGIEFGTPTFLERPKYPDEKRYQFADTMTWISGNHTIKFGGDINYVTDDLANLRTEAGAYSYNNINDFIIDYVNWQTPLNPLATCTNSATRFVGRCYTSNYAQGIGNPGYLVKTTDYNFFAQDDWRVSPRLTVNLGLRWEYIKMPATTLASTNTTIIPTDGRTIAQATSTLPNDKDNFGPRFGFAYDLFGDGKTSIRGGYGIYYGRIQNSTIYNALVNTGNPGGQAQVSIAPTTTTGCFPATVGATIPCAPVFPQVLVPSTLTFAAGAIQYFAKNFEAPMIQQYDLILEHQFANSVVGSVSYIGSFGRQLPTFLDYNLAQTGTTTYNVVGGPAGGRTFTLPLYTRPLPAFSQLTQIASDVSTQYDAIVFQAKRRFTNGLAWNASYTIAKATDLNQNSATFTQNNSPYDVFDRSYDKGPSNLDVRQKFVASAVYAPNPFKGSTRSAYNYLVNGWSFSPIFVYYSGRAYDGTVSGTTLNGSSGDNRFPLNPRNIYRLPSLINIDARLSKRFRITETTNLEFLVEGFNLVNRTQIFGVNNTLYSRSGNTLTFNPSFGQVTTTDSTLYRERQIQYSLRFQF